ncbi:MAG: hypothetical protein N2Z72_07845 [Bacteroidales bacterium]|nr:hypothetical protein [Bacteroidales bacterium]
MHSKVLKFLFFYQFTALVCFSQYTFSHFWMRDMRLNPALTGVIPAKWKLGYDIRLYRNDTDRTNWSTTYFVGKKIFYKEVGKYAKDKQPSGWVLGFGFLDDRRRGNMNGAYFIADYLSLSLQKFNKSGYQDSVISFGLQLGFLRDGMKALFDVNAGVLFGWNSILCWQEDQYLAYQIGIAGYHLLFPFRKKNEIFPGRTVHLHGGALVKYNKNIHLVLNGLVSYSNQTELVIGSYAILFPEIHYFYWDRLKVGIHYRLSNHLVLSSGIRIYGKARKSLSLEITGSYDLPMSFMDFKYPYKHAWEIGFYIIPHEKCWNISPCAML